MSTGEGEPTFWADYESGGCKQNCLGDEAVGCEPIPPPVRDYESVEACCSEGMSWVNMNFCTSRSAGEVTDLWVVDYQSARCGESTSASTCCAFMLFMCIQCDSSISITGSHDTVQDSTSNRDKNAAMFTSPEQCCNARLSWVVLSTCVGSSGVSGIPVPMLDSPDDFEGGDIPVPMLDSPNTSEEGGNTPAPTLESPASGAAGSADETMGGEKTDEMDEEVEDSPPRGKKGKASKKEGNR